MGKYKKQMDIVLYIKITLQHLCLYDDTTDLYNNKDMVFKKLINNNEDKEIFQNLIVQIKQVNLIIWHFLIKLNCCYLVNQT